jgi:hypothetical protein
MVKRSLLILMLAACGKFEDPAIVIDLRPIALGADFPEQVVSVDAMSQPADILAQLRIAHIQVLIADQNFERRIRWHAELCWQDDSERCDHSSPWELLGEGVWEDPDEVQIPGITVPKDGNLLGILVDELDQDPLHGLGGLTYGLSLRIGGEDADPSLDQYMSKGLMVSPAIPAGRTPNKNPTLDSISAEVDGGDDFPLPLRSCAEAAAPLVVAPGQKVRMEPVERSDTRETYAVPTLDGMMRTFTEAVTYQWLATAGKFSDSTTGGGHDPFGNLKPTHTEWTAPSADKLDGPTDISFWIIQRDERLGVNWVESCVRVVP